MIRIQRIMTVCLLMVACVADAENEPPVPDSRVDESRSGVADGARHTSADFQALRYLEGDWRGSGYEGGPFYESYRFVNDSTIEMTAWTDSTMTTAREHSQYMLRDGVIRTADGARLVRVDEDGHHFQAASYGWTFRQVGPDRWTARVGPSTIYTMDRMSGS